MKLDEFMKITEVYIDEHGIDDVLIALSVICMDKAAHIETSYGKDGTSKAWNRASVYLDRVAHNKSIQDDVHL